MPDRPPPRVAVRAALAARRALMALADRMVPARFALFDGTIGVGRTHVLGTLAELGVADLLAEGPATAAELSRRLEVDGSALHRIMRAAAVEGLFRLDRHGRFRLGRLGRALCTDARGSIRDWARYMALRSSTEAWADLTESVRTGQPAFPRVHGRSVWQWFAEHPEEERLFAGAMRRITQEFAPAVVAGYPWPRGGVVCDVGGGVGTLLATLLRARDDLRGILVEAPGVLAEADAWLDGAGVRDRVQLRAGDVFTGIDARADVYLLKDFLHDWDDGSCARILANVRAAMPAGARLVLVETLQEPNRPDLMASLQDVQMLTQCDGGRQRSAAELGELLRGAGLEPGAVRATIGPSLVEGVAA